MLFEKLCKGNHVRFGITTTRTTVISHIFRQIWWECFSAIFEDHVRLKNSRNPVWTSRLKNFIAITPSICHPAYLMQKCQCCVHTCCCCQHWTSYNSSNCAYNMWALVTFYWSICWRTSVFMDLKDKLKASLDDFMLRAKDENAIFANSSIRSERNVL